MEEMLRERSRDAFDTLSDMVGDYPTEPQLWAVQEKIKTLRKGNDQDMLDKLLMNAMGVQDYQLITTILKAGADPNAVRPYRDAVKTPLMLALEANNGDAVCLLVRAGARLSGLPGQFPSAYLFALSRGQEVLADLVASLGAPTEEPDELGKNALFFWATFRRMDKVRELLVQGLAPDLMEAYSQRPLINYLFPVLSPEDPLVDLWLEKVRGKNLVAQCSQVLWADLLEDNAFQPSSEHLMGWVKCLAKEGLLVDDATLLDPTHKVRLSGGLTPALMAARTGNLPLLQWLQQAGAPMNALGARGESIVTQAAYSWQVPVVKYLQEQGFPIDSPDVDGDTPLMRVIDYGGNHAALAAAGGTCHEKPSREAMVSYLIEAGADINHPNHQGMTPLMLAANWQPKSVRLLLEAGARLDMMDQNGRTPLSHASRTNCEETFELLRTWDPPKNLAPSVP